MPGVKAERPALSASLSLGSRNGQASPSSGASTGPEDVASARTDTLPDPRFIKNKRSGGSALMKKFFPGDDEDELPDIKPAAAAAPKSGSAGWQRIDGGPMRKDIDVPLSERVKDTTKSQAEARIALPDETSGNAQSAPATVPSATPMDVDTRGAVPEHGSTRGPSAFPLSPNRISQNAAPSAPAPPPVNRNSQRLITSPSGTGANTEDAHPPHKSKPIEPAPTTPRDGEIYTIVSQVGEGTFGQVYKAVNTQNNSRVALKRIRMEGEKDGFPVTAMREIKLLQSLRHENVVKLHEMMVSKSTPFRSFYLAKMLISPRSWIRSHGVRVHGS